MLRTEYVAVPVFCTVCTNPVPEARANRGANTCTDDCQTVRRTSNLARRELKVCRYCGRPSTPEERTAFLRFRRAGPRAIVEERAAYERFHQLETENPEVLYPDQYRDWLKTQDKDTKPNPGAFMEWLTKTREERGQK